MDYPDLSWAALIELTIIIIIVNIACSMVWVVNSQVIIEDLCLAAGKMIRNPILGRTPDFNDG